MSKIDEIADVWNKSFKSGLIQQFAQKKSSQQRERVLVIHYLQNIHVEGMRKHLCFSCRYSTLYDKNNKPYLVSRTDTLERVKGIVEEIKKVNQETV